LKLDEFIPNLKFKHVHRSSIKRGNSLALNVGGYSKKMLTLSEDIFLQIGFCAYLYAFTNQQFKK